MDELPKYKANSAFANIGLDKKPSTFVRGASQYSSGGDQGGRIVSSEKVFDLQPVPLTEERRPSPTAETIEPEEQCVGFGIYTRVIGSERQVWIGAGTIEGFLPTGFDSILGKFIADGGSGFIWASVTINENTGEIESSEISSGGSVPSNTFSTFNYTLGFYEYIDAVPTFTNYGCGSLAVSVCRNWFRTTAPFYGVSISR